LQQTFDNFQNARRDCRNPSGFYFIFRLTQGNAFVATLGWRP
jgi:hypothetical protein